jgi:hypothetical protein
MQGIVKIVTTAFFCLITGNVFAQVDYDKMDSITEEMMDKGDWDGLANYGTNKSAQGVNYFTMNDRTGRALFSLKLFSKSERFLKKALSQNSSSTETAQYLYGSLLEQGRDLEAGAIRKKYSIYGGGDTKKTIEGFYGEGGVKLAAMKDRIGNIHYYSFGMTHRPSYCSRIWQSFTYLSQDFHGDGYKQYEYFISINQYAGHYFYVRPSFHYAFTNYSSSLSTNLPYLNSSTQVVQNGLLTHEISGTQTNTYATPGQINSINLATNFSRRFGNLIIEAEPSIHLINHQQQASNTSNIIGTSDTLVNGIKVGSGNYSSVSSTSKQDSIISRNIFQLSTGITYRLPLEFVTLKLFGHFVSYSNQQDFDVSFNAFIRASNNVWLHLSYLEKKDLPLALNGDGQYFNSGNPVKSRVGFSVQLHPLKKFTQYLTYQFEEQGKFNSSESYKYNSFYLTLKYNL